jgi:hypothetical protein
MSEHLGDFDGDERRLRTMLHRRVEGVEPLVPPVVSVIRRARARQNRQHVALGAVAVAGLVGSGAVMLRPRPDVHVAGWASATDGPAARPPLTTVAGTGDTTKVVLDGWTTTYFVALPGQGDEAGYVEYQFERDGRELQVSFYESTDLASRTGPGGTVPPGTVPAGTVPVGTTPGTTVEGRVPVEVRGVTGQALDYGGGRLRVNWVEGDRVWEADGAPFTLPDLVEVLAAIHHPDEATWQASLPEGTVLPDTRAQAVEALLQGVPLPPGVDGQALVRGAPASSYDLAAHVYGRVMCGWADQWLAGAGTPPRMAADKALRSVPSWPGLAAMDDHGDYGHVVREMARQVLAGDEEAARHMPDAMGCPGAQGW